MSRRIALSVAAGLVVLGGAGAGAFALAHAGEQAPTLAGATARYTAPDGDREGSLSFVTDVTAGSGVQSVKVLAWPEDSSLAEKELTPSDMAAAEPADCTPSGKDTVRCSYTVQVTGADAASSPRGRWHVAVLATAQDGTSTLDPEAAGFTVR
ncbi:DUF5707 domain-containing protein [Streptomyces antibioticus]|uniref:DUF5707 domain-containing protein n=1 Tax=Streptomyces antibioticus TaxID=1890 RepID=UPI002258EA15|nr:DUF5707 domain-containing protein [Streptomyces antibioticus]MCX4737062.1 DUF5707 domain-containing protein [Streptomyces antibioticus]